MMIRVGIESSFRRYGALLREMGAPGLISANALRRAGRVRFKHPTIDYLGGLDDVALDSAGFVAMVRYGGYPWSVAEYVALAGSFPWAWWASMDYCCEPEIARDRDEVLARVQRTADMLETVRNEAGRQGVRDPMPVLQGWKPDDYLRSLDLTLRLVGAAPLMGLGSVCRRNVSGPDGIVAVLDRLDRAMQPGTRLHLFGVKSDILSMLHAWSGRVASVDSMAWDFRARKDARERGVSCSVDHKQGVLRGWFRRQTERVGETRGVQLELGA
jgi:hypothetical protein